MGRVANSQLRRDMKTGRAHTSVWSHRRAGAFVVVGGAIFWAIILLALFRPHFI